MPGAFITFEGGEGAGKSTQIERLRRRLEAQGHSVLVTREPGGSERAERIREFLLSGRAKALGTFAETILFSAARLDHLEKTIRPALAAGRIVLSDRFSDSTRAYQGAAGALEPDLLDAVERVVLAGTEPVLTLILDLPESIGMSRAVDRRGDARADRFEGEGAAFHAALRQAFLDVAKAAPQRCAVIDGSRDPDTVEKEIWDVVRTRLPDLAAPREHVAHG
ncbi:dTMP kinase [Microvirga massiliensis]|uniref:dTMP kinase n=1 Tax=Microvirga massiliensis TaxID=1033741 RepID=UPI00062B5186|nr:dTMP kinase [Microvirga massiliensis]